MRAVLIVLAVSFWRSATNLQGHTRAAAQAIAESISRQTKIGRAEGEAAELQAHRGGPGAAAPGP